MVGYKADATHYLTTLTSLGVQVDVLTGANITSEAKMNFITANNAIYCMNGVDTYGKLSGATYSIPTSGIANFKPTFGTYFNNCGWVTGLPTNPTKLYKSVSNNLDDYSGAGSDAFTAPYNI